MCPSLLTRNLGGAHFRAVAIVGCLALGAPAPRAEAQTGAPSTPQDQSQPQVVATSGVADQPPVRRGQAILEQAIVAMESRQSVAAKIRHRFELFGHGQMVGTGTYLEQRSEAGQVFRMELKIHLESRAATLLEVFDGRNLWAYDDANGEKLTRVDVIQVAQALKQKGNLPQVGEIGKWPGLGGLSRLLRGINAAFEFGEPEEAAFTLADGAEQRALPVWKLRGTWTTERLVRLLPDQAEDIQQGKPARLEKLAEHLPDHVVVYLGKEDLFPYEIDYRRTPPQRFWQRTPPESKSIVVMEFPEVNLNAAIPASEFTYKPGGLAASDVTAAFISKLDSKMK